MEGDNTQEINQEEYPSNMGDSQQQQYEQNYGNEHMYGDEEGGEEGEEPDSYEILEEHEDGSKLIQMYGKQQLLTAEQFEDFKLNMEAQGHGEEIYEEGEERERNYDDDDDYEEGEEGKKNQDDNDDYDENLFEDEEGQRKIKRDLIDNFNKERRARNMDPLNVELLSTVVANKYATHLLDQDHNQQYFQELLEKKYKFEDDYQLCYIQASYEVEEEVNQQHIHDYFMEVGYLFLEDQVDKQHLLNPEFNHIGLGISLDSDKVVIALILCTKLISVLQIYQEPQGFKIRGRILKKDEQGKEIGVCAVKVRKMDGDQLVDHEIKGVGAESMQYKSDRDVKEYVVHMEQHTLDPVQSRCEKYLDIYTRINPDSIAYGRNNKRGAEKAINYKVLQLRLRVPCQPYPDPRFAQEDEDERLRMQEEQDRMIAEQQRQQDLQQQAEEEAMREQYNDDNLDDSDENQDDEDEEEDEEYEQNDRNEEKEPQISNKEIREDLERAIHEAKTQHKEFVDQNKILQQRIKAIKNKNDVLENKNETTMNDHKYLNTLAHVHLIRLDLQQTQKNYNMMSKKLQEKLEDKQKKCNEIKIAFMDLKRQVCQKAAYSRNDKPIPEKLIEEWEQKEIEKDKILQELRLDNLRLRNTLMKNQKVLKKKEELAEGLHLIDFEQLKIENQTLNEKIEERNEDLHKLKKKNTNTVQILTHTKEKLKFVLAEKEQKIKEEEELNEKLTKARTKLAADKEQKVAAQNQVQKYKQITGISKSAKLANDFNKLREKIEVLKQEQKTLKQELAEKQKVIVEYANYNAKQMQMQSQEQMY